MAIAGVATEYVFSDFLLKEPPEAKYKGVRLELAVERIVTFIAVGLPLLLISLAFAQEVSVGTQISCFPPTNFSRRQGAYVDSFCWAAIQNSREDVHAPLWLHKFFPYILLLVAILMYVPALFWRFTAAPHLFSDLNFIMEELDRTYNRAIKLAKSLMSNQETSDAPADSHSSVLDLAEGCFKYPLVEQYLKTKRTTRGLVIKYLICRGLTLINLLLACIYLGYYINLASVTDEFACNIRTGILQDATSIPNAMQCKLVAVGVFQLLSCINLAVYALLAPIVIYTILIPARQSSAFLRPYEALPTFGIWDLTTSLYDDLSVYLLFLEENLSELKSYRCLQVLQLIQESGEEGLDTMCLLRTLSQVKTDVVDRKARASAKAEPKEDDSPTELKDNTTLLLEDKKGKGEKSCDEKSARQRVI